MALRAGARGHHQQGLCAVVGEQHLTVDLDAAERRVEECLAVLEALGDLVPRPHAYELGAAFAQFGDDARGPVPAAVGGQRGPERGCLDPALLRMVLLRVVRPLLRVGEPAVVGTARQPFVAGLVAEQCHRERVLGQGVTDVGHHQSRGVHTVQHTHQGRADVVGPLEAGRSAVARETEEMVPLVQGETQRAGERGGHLLGGLRAAPLFKARVVVGGHAGEPGHLFAAQSRRAPAWTAGQTDILGAQRLTPPPQEVRQFRSVHAPMMAAARPAIQGPPIHG